MEVIVDGMVTDGNLDALMGLEAESIEILRSGPRA